MMLLQVEVLEIKPQQIGNKRIDRRPRVLSALSAFGIQRRSVELLEPPVCELKSIRFLPHFIFYRIFLVSLLCFRFFFVSLGLLFLPFYSNVI